MNANEMCKRISGAKEFVLDEGSLCGLESAIMEAEKEYRSVIDTLIMSYWRLPKIQQQEGWIKLLIEKIESRKDAVDFTRKIIERIKEMWLEIDIRRIEKFVMLLDQLVEYLFRKVPARLNEFIRRGPNGLYDTTIMKQVIASKKQLEEKDMLYLLKYLLDNPDTYFRDFFMSVIIPKIQTQGVYPSVADMAYEFGSNPECTRTMRKVLYAVCEIKRATR